MINPDHINFFEELKELLKKHNAIIVWTSDYLIFNFKGNSAGCYYQMANPLVAGESSHTFDGIEFVRTEEVFKAKNEKE